MMHSFTWNQFHIKICDSFLAYFTCVVKLLVSGTLSQSWYNMVSGLGTSYTRVLVKYSFNPSTIKNIFDMYAHYL